MTRPALQILSNQILYTKHEINAFQLHFSIFIFH